MILLQITSIPFVLMALSLIDPSSAQFWKNDKIVKQWQQNDDNKSPSSSSNSIASSYMNAFVPAAVNSGLGSLIGSYQPESSKDISSPSSSQASVKDDYAKNYASASVPSSGAATYEHAPSLKSPQPSPNYAPAYPSYEYKYPSSYEYKAPSYGSHEYKAPSYGSHEYKAPSYGSHEYKAPSYGSHEYKAPSYGSHEYKSPSYGSHEHHYQAVLPPSILPQGAYPIHQPTITNTGETIIENLVGGISFDCRGRSTGHWRDTKYCDIFHACVFGIQRKTYVCPYVGERTYFDETTRRCEFVYRNPHGCGSNSYYH